MLYTPAAPQHMSEDSISTSFNPGMAFMSCRGASVIRPSEEPGDKGDDLQRILFGTDPKRSVVIGDDPDDELRYGAALGCLTIDVRTYWSNSRITVLRNQLMCPITP